MFLSWTFFNLHTSRGNRDTSHVPFTQLQQGWSFHPRLHMRVWKGLPLALSFHAHVLWMGFSFRCRPFFSGQRGSVGIKLGLSERAQGCGPVPGGGRSQDRPDGQERPQPPGPGRLLRRCGDRRYRSGHAPHLCQASGPRGNSGAEPSPSVHDAGPVWPGRACVLWGGFRFPLILWHAVYSRTGVKILIDSKGLKFHGYKLHARTWICVHTCICRFIFLQFPCK